MRPEGQADPQIMVVGDVGLVHINISWATLAEYGEVDETGRIESELVMRLTDPAERDELQGQFDRAVKQAFDSEAFYAQPYVVFRGRSVEVLVIISAIYTAIVKFNEVVDALTKAAALARPPTLLLSRDRCAEVARVAGFVFGADVAAAVDIVVA